MSVLFAIVRSFHSSVRYVCFKSDKLDLNVNFKYALSSNNRKKWREDEGNRRTRAAVDRSASCNAKSDSNLIFAKGLGLSGNIQRRDKVIGLENNDNGVMPTMSSDGDDDCAILSEDLMKIENETVIRYPGKPRTVKKSNVESSIKGEVLFGINPVKIALYAKKRAVHRLFVKRDASKPHNERILQLEMLARQFGVAVDKVDTRILDGLSGGRLHQGVCLDVGKLDFETLHIEGYRCEMSQCKASEDVVQLWILLYKIQDPMNFGAVLRSSYYFGVDRVLTVSSETCKLTPVVSKASSGAMEILTVYQVQNAIKLLNSMIQDGWCVIGSASLDSPTHFAVNREKTIDLGNFLWPKRTVLLIGNEGDGIAHELLEICEKIIVLPGRRELHPNMQSLNVSVATGIILNSFCMQVLKK